MFDYIIACLLLGATFALSFFAVWQFLNTIKDIFRTWFARKNMIESIMSMKATTDKLISQLQELNKPAEKEKKKKK